MPCDKTTSRGPGWRVFSRGIRKGRLYFLLLGKAEVQGASLDFFLLAAAEVRCQSILLYTTCSLVWLSIAASLYTDCLVLGAAEVRSWLRSQVYSVLGFFLLLAVT
jgi:hypothetical protein